MMFVCFFFSELVMRNLISCKPVFEFHLHCNNPVAARSDKLSQTKASLHLTTTQDRYCSFGGLTKENCIAQTLFFKGPTDGPWGPLDL